MTKTEIVNQMNNIRATLQKDQTMLLELLNHIMGCTMLVEKLAREVQNMEQPVPEVDVVEEPVPEVDVVEEPVTDEDGAENA